MWNPFKKTADKLSKKTNDVLESFNKTIENLSKVQQQIMVREDELYDEIKQREAERVHLSSLSERNQRIINKFSKLLE